MQLAVKRDGPMEKSVSDVYNCACGLPAPLTHKTIKTKYNDVFISVHNVPVYECQDHHVKMSRLTRVKLTEALKRAYTDNDQEAWFEK